MAGNLQIISIAGGLLRLSQPLDTNTRASLMFLTDGRPVLGKAEMLSPLSRTQQAFRFDHSLMWVWEIGHPRRP